MDRSQIIGLILMLVLITIYFQVFESDKIKPSSGSGVSSNESLVTGIKDHLNAQIPDNPLSQFPTGSEELKIIENEKVRITLSNKGGTIKNVVLKGYKDFRGDDLVLVDNTSEQNLIINYKSREINLSDLYLKGEEDTRNDTTFISYRIEIDDNKSITLVYSLPNKGYVVDYKIITSGLDNQIVDDYRFEWKVRLKRLEKNVDDARNKSKVLYRLSNGDVDDISSSEETFLKETANWVSFNQKYFTSAIVFDQPKEGIKLSNTDIPNDTTYLRTGIIKFNIDKNSNGSNLFNAKFYFLPNDFDVLQNVAPSFIENLDLGWGILGWINEFAIIPIFKFLESHISNYGLIIMIMVILVRLILTPLTYKSHIGTAKMRFVKPELDEIKEKYKDDPKKAQQEQMTLFQKAGINPLSGCVPLLLQTPILISLFYFFPSAIELRHEGFLWVNDLSTYDSIINLLFNIPFYGDHVSLFTILMSTTSIISMKMNTQFSSTSSQPQMKVLQYFIPVMMIFFFNNYASGLTFYYFFSNVISIVQVALIGRFINEDKIKTVIAKNRQKNHSKKKSSFQRRLEKAMKSEKG